METQQLTTTRHVVRPWQNTRKQTNPTALRALLRSLRDAVSIAWQGDQDAVKEIRSQREPKRT